MEFPAREDLPAAQLEDPPRPMATNSSPTAGARQLIENCEASTDHPATVAAAKPHAVSSNAAIMPEWRNPEYCPMSSGRHVIRSSHSPSTTRTTWNPAHRLNDAVALPSRNSSSMCGLRAPSLLTRSIAIVTIGSLT
jgi:hypothetical protein